MELEIKIQIALFVASTIALILLMYTTKRVTTKVTAVKHLEPNRKKVVINAFYFLFYLLYAIAVFYILGINLQELSIFFSSLLAVIGIAFFAQWSLLSNLTASIIIFFYHPLKIGNQIKILDKELDFEGVVTDMTGFYVSIETREGKRVSIPNSIILQKGVQFLD